MDIDVALIMHPAPYSTRGVPIWNAKHSLACLWCELCMVCWLQDLYDRITYRISSQNYNLTVQGNHVTVVPVTIGNTRRCVSGL